MYNLYVHISSVGLLINNNKHILLIRCICSKDNFTIYRCKNNIVSILIPYYGGVELCHWHVKTIKQNLQANSRSAYQFWHKREKKARSSFAKLHIESLSTPEKLSLFSLYRKRFQRYGPIFKIVISGYEILTLKKVSKVAYVLFLPQGSNLNLFSLYGQPFSRYGPVFNISIFGHEIWNLKKSPKVAYVLSFYLRGSKLSLFSLYGQQFSRQF